MASIQHSGLESRQGAAPFGGSHPIGHLIGALPLIPVHADGTMDFVRAEPALLAQLGEASEAIASAMHLGVGAIGQLMAFGAPEIEDGTIDSEAVEALGWLLSMLGELGAQATLLALKCRHAASGRSLQPRSSSPHAAPPAPPPATT